jgi:hypothetical protein
VDEEWSVHHRGGFWTLKSSSLPIILDSVYIRPWPLLPEETKGLQ